MIGAVLVLVVIAVGAGVIGLAVGWLLSEISPSGFEKRRLRKLVKELKVAADKSKVTP